MSSIFGHLPEPPQSSFFSFIPNLFYILFVVTTSQSLSLFDPFLEFSLNIHLHHPLPLSLKISQIHARFTSLLRSYFANLSLQSILLQFSPQPIFRIRFSIRLDSLYFRSPPLTHKHKSNSITSRELTSLDRLRSANVAQ